MSSTRADTITPSDAKAAGAAGASGSATSLSWKRAAAAVVIGLVCVLALWIATPYNNLLMGNSAISDDYLPVGMVFIMLLLVLGFNPLLRIVRPQWALVRSQLALIMAILLIGSVVPAFGLMQSLPYMLATNPSDVNNDKLLAEQYRAMDLPESAFPDKLGLGRKTPVSDAMRGRPPQGQPAPWREWLGPLRLWGIFLVFGWMMMIGLSQIVLPQWRNNERLAFPLLTVQQSLIEDPSPGRWFAPIFHSRSFWVAAGAVFVLHMLAGANLYLPERVPSIPLKWNFGALMTEEPWHGLPMHFYAGQIYFAFVGLAFFMPNRIGFSIWFFIVAYAFYRMVGMVYLPPFEHNTMIDHRTGGMLVMAIAILWLGRNHWVRVFGSMFTRGDDAEGAAHDRNAGWLFVLGLAGMMAWLLWLKLPIAWAVMLVCFAFMSALLIARVVAETGMPFMRVRSDGLLLMKLAPLKWLSPIAMFLATMVTVLFPVSSRIGVSAMAVQGGALVGDDQPRPRTQTRLGWLFLGILVLGVLVCGPIHVWMNYHNDMTVDGNQVNGWGRGLLVPANDSIKELARGDVSRPNYDPVRHILFGAVLAGLLYWLSITVPTWPLHPIGLMLVDTPSYGNKVWASIFVGWAIKNLIVRFGGAMGYRAARFAFLGLILGEVFAAVVWAGVQLVMVNQGLILRALEILPG
jgi:hypothetical protein